MTGALPSCSSWNGAMKSDPTSGRPIVLYVSLLMLWGAVDVMLLFQGVNFVSRFTLTRITMPFLQCKTS